MKALGRIDAMDDWEILQFARDIVERSKAPLDTLRAQQEEELVKNQDFLARSAIRQIEEANKRRLTQGASEFLKQAFSMISSWLRDVAMVRAGAPELVINTDFAADIEACAAIADDVLLSRALRAAEEAKTSLDYNVSPETCVDVMLFKTREVFDAKNRTR